MFQTKGGWPSIHRHPLDIKDGKWPQSRQGKCKRSSVILPTCAETGSFPLARSVKERGEHLSSLGCMLLGKLVSFRSCFWLTSIHPCFCWQQSSFYYAQPSVKGRVDSSPGSRKWPWSGGLTGWVGWSGTARGRDMVGSLGFISQEMRKH